MVSSVSGTVSPLDNSKFAPCNYYTAKSGEKILFLSVPLWYSLSWRLFSIDQFALNSLSMHPHDRHVQLYCTDLFSFLTRRYRILASSQAGATISQSIAPPGACSRPLPQAERTEEVCVPDSIK